jgi:CRISPR-associated protein Csm5
MSNAFLSAWQLAITPLAPLHIGTGEDFDPTNYVIDDMTLFSFSPEAALRALPESGRRELLNLVNGRPDVAMIKQVQALFHRHRERLVPFSEHAMPVLPSIAAEYAQRVGKTAQREESGREIINRLRIERTYADPTTRRPILPGSSLKGAIRTALLDAEHGGEGLPEDVKALPRQQQNRALQQRLFRYRQFDLDPMRLVQAGDAQDVSPPDQFGTEVRYAVNRKRHSVLKEGREIAAQAENLRQVLECVPPLRPRAFASRLTTQVPGDLQSRKLPDPALRWTLEDIAGACNAFYRPIFDREMRELRARSYLDSDWADRVEQLLTACASALEQGRAFLLRVGRHSGAESVTLNGVRNIKILMGKDPETGRMRWDHLSASKTFWLAGRDLQDRRDLLPFGWALVECAPVGQSLADWPESLTHALAHDDGGQWQRRVAARQAELRGRLEAEAVAAAERQAAQAQAEREAAERMARLEALSPEARALEEIATRFADDQVAGRKEPGGELANRLADLMRTAAEWDNEPREQLADLAERIYAYIGWGNAKKRQQKRERIDALRT